MFYTIYQITNLVNGKIYIGKHQTENLNDNYLGSGKLLNRAIEKYSKDSFSKDILHIFDNEDEMNAKEKELVTEDFCSLKSNYNLCPGGHGGFGYLNSKEMLNKTRKFKIFSAQKTNSRIWKDENFIERKKISASKNFKKLNKSGLLKSSGFKNKSHTDEWKEKHSLLMKEISNGNKNSQFGTMWITNGVVNRKIKKDDPIPEDFSKGRVLISNG